MTYKTIFSGRLEFGSPRSYEKVTQMYEHRVENFYRSEILLKGEEIFDEESHSLNVPRFITQASDKTWRNTINLLEYVAQFAVAGDLSAWMTDEGKVINHKVVEPKSDKAAVQAFLTGRKLVKEAGRETEAKKALSQAIEKFERHAKAYERRGFVNFQLKNYSDALYDYNKSIDINPGNPDAYLGRAFIYIHQNDLDKAIDDLNQAIKRSIPLQPIYWKARRIKGELHLRKEDYKAAILEFKLFTARKFLSTDSNYEWRKYAFFNYGKALLAAGAYKEAVNAFNEASKLESGAEDCSDAELLLHRGMALQKAGQAGYLKDWKAAADQGSKRAAELLEATA
jgi:tetratricopeptide (TPR) repeat protein